LLKIEPDAVRALSKLANHKPIPSTLNATSSK
jgi:hypothetical protein